MTNGRPWFKFFPSDWLGSRETRFLTPEQRGYLIQLKAESWQSEPCGTLPADIDALWRLAGAVSRKRFEANAEAVLRSFRLEGDRYVCDEQVSQFRSMESVGQERRIAGTLGAKKRWQPNGKRIAIANNSPWQTHGDTDLDEEQKREKIRDSQQDSERRSENGELRPDVLGPLAGLTKAVIREKAMPGLPGEADLRDRLQTLKEQVASLTTHSKQGR